jgi:hypothetical protein
MAQGVGPCDLKARISGLQIVGAIEIAGVDWPRAMPHCDLKGTKSTLNRGGLLPPARVHDPF